MHRGEYLPSVEIRLVDMNSIRCNSNDRAIFLVKSWHLFWHNAAAEGIVIDVVAIAELGKEGARDMSKGMEEQSVDEQTKEVCDKGDQC